MWNAKNAISRASRVIWTLDHVKLTHSRDRKFEPNNCRFELKDGMFELKNGMFELKDGMFELKDRMFELIV